MNTRAQQEARPRGACVSLVIGSTAVVLTIISLAGYSKSVDLHSILLASVIWSMIVWLVWTTVHTHHHRVFGLANRITLGRTAFTTILASLIPVAHALNTPVWLWTIAIGATLTLCLDGLDGYVARSSGLSSEFGARFDMETDAFLGLVITLFIWQSGKVGLWVLGLGVLRYLFVIASFWLAPLRADLYPSLRRKTICVIQVGALCLMLCPWLSAFQASIVGMLALACLVYSFSVDVRWLFQQVGKSRILVPEHQPERGLKNTKTRPGRQPIKDVSA